jgi:hypothetical protein
MSHLSPHREDATSLRDARGELGEPVMVCRPSRAKSVAWLLAASAVCLTGAGFAVVGLALQGMSVAVVVGSALALTGAGFAVAQLRGLSLRVYVCRDGLAVARGGTVETCRWDDVEALWESAIRHYWKPLAMPVFLGTAYKIRVRRADGAAFAFAGNTSGGQLLLPGNLYGVAELGAAIRDATHHRLLSQAELSIRAGGTVAFGPLQVGEAGLSSGAGTLPWAEVEGIAVNADGKIEVRKVGQWRKWCKVKASAVPNVSVFVTLVHQIMARGVADGMGRPPP